LFLFIYIFIELLQFWNMQDFEAKDNPPGWWKISVSLKNLKKLDEVKKKLKEELNER